MIEEIDESQCSLVEYCKLVNVQSTDIQRDGQLITQQFKSQNYQFSKILGHIFYRGKVYEGREIKIQRIDTLNQGIELARFQVKNWKITLSSFIVENGCQFIEYQKEIQLLTITQCGEVSIYNFMADEETLIKKLEGNDFQCLAQPNNNLRFFVFDSSQQMVILQLDEHFNQFNTAIIDLNRFNINLKFVKDYFRAKSNWKLAFALTPQSVLYYSREEQFQIVNVVNRKSQIIQLNYSQNIDSKQILFFPYSNVKSNQLRGAVGTIVIVQDNNIIILQITIRDALIQNNCNICDCNMQTISDASLNRVAILETPYDINRNQCDIILNDKTLFIIRDESIYYYHLIGQYEEEFKPLFTQTAGNQPTTDYKGCLVVNDIPLIIYQNCLKTIITTTNNISQIQKRIEQQGFYYQMKIIQQHVNLMKFFQQYQFEFQQEEQSIQYLTVINLIFNTNKIFQILINSFQNQQYNIYAILEEIILAEEETLVFVCETFKKLNNQQVKDELLRQLDMIVSEINRQEEPGQIIGSIDHNNNGTYQSYLNEIFYQQIYDHFKLLLHCIIGIGVLSLYNFECIQFQFKPTILETFKLLFCVLASKKELAITLTGQLTFTSKLHNLKIQQLESDLDLVERVGLQKITLKKALGLNIKTQHKIMMEKLLNLKQTKISLLNEFEEDGKVSEAVILLKECDIQNTEEVVADYLRYENYQEFKTSVGLRFLVSNSSYELKYRIFKNAIKSSQFRLIFYFLLLFDLRLDENAEIGQFFQEYFFNSHGDNQIINHLSEYRFRRRVTQMIGDYIIRRNRDFYLKKEGQLDIDQHLTVIMNQVAFLNKQDEVYQTIILMIEFLYYIENRDSDENRDVKLLKQLQIENNLLSYILEECAQIEKTSIYSTQFICQVNQKMFDLLNQNDTQQAMNSYDPIRTIVDMKQIKKLYLIKKAYFHALTKKGQFQICNIFLVLICLEQQDQLIDLWKHWNDPNFERNLSLIYIKLDRNKREDFVNKLLGIKEINQKQVVWVLTEMIIHNKTSIPLDTMFEMTNEKETIIEALLQFKQISIAQDFTMRYLKSLKNSEKQQFINYNLIARVIEYKTENFEQLKQWIFDEKFLKE